jgi:hypothetical protein
MSNLQNKITNTMLQLQILLDEAGLDENEPVQDAFNALACALDEELVEE